MQWTEKQLKIAEDKGWGAREIAFCEMCCRQHKKTLANFGVTYIAKHDYDKLSTRSTKGKIGINTYQMEKILGLKWSEFLEFRA